MNEKNLQRRAGVHTGNPRRMFEVSQKCLSQIFGIQSKLWNLLRGQNVYKPGFRFAIDGLRVWSGPERILSMKSKLLKVGVLGLTTSLISTVQAQEANVQVDTLIKKMENIPGLGVPVWGDLGFVGTSNNKGEIVVNVTAIPEGFPLTSSERVVATVKIDAEGNTEILHRGNTPSALYQDGSGVVVESVAGNACGQSPLDYQLNNHGNLLSLVKFSGGNIQSSVCSPSFILGNDFGLALYKPEGETHLLSQSGMEHPEYASAVTGISAISTPDYFSLMSQTSVRSYLAPDSMSGDGVVRVGAMFPYQRYGGLYGLIGSTGELPPLARVGRTFSQLPGYRISNVPLSTNNSVSFQSSRNGKYIVELVHLQNSAGEGAVGLVRWSSLNPSLRLMYVSGHRFDAAQNRFVRLPGSYYPSPDKFEVNDQGTILYRVTEGNGQKLMRLRLQSGRPVEDLIATYGQAYSSGSARIAYIKDFKIDSAGRIFTHMTLATYDQDNNPTLYLPAIRRVNTDNSITDLYNPFTTNLLGRSPKFQNNDGILSISTNSTGSAFVCGSHGPNGGQSTSSSCHLFTNNQAYLVSESGMPEPLDSSRQAFINSLSLIGINSRDELLLMGTTRDASGSNEKNEIFWFGQDKQLRQVNRVSQTNTGEMIELLPTFGLTSNVGNWATARLNGLSDSPNLVLHAKVYSPSARRDNMQNEPWVYGVVKVNFDQDPSNPSICLADFNQSGTVSVQDLFDYLAAYSSQNMTADMNHDNSIGISDFFDFYRLYLAGGC